MRMTNNGNGLRSRRRVIGSAATAAVQPLERRQMMTFLLGYDVSGQSAYGVSPLAATVVDASLTTTAAQGLSRGSGVTTTGTAAGRAFGGNGFAASGTEATSVAANQYYQFGFTVAAGRTVSLSSLDDSYRRPASGPASAALQYSVNGAAYADIAQLSNASTASAGATINQDLTGVAALQNIAAGTAVSFRLVPYGATATTGTYYVFDVGVSTAADLDLQGTSASSVTTTQGVSFANASTPVTESAPTVSLTVTRSGTTNGNDSSGTVSVPYSTADGTAKAGTNYTATTGTLTFGPGVTTQTIIVPVTDAANQGGDKTFTVNLGTPTITGQTAGVTVTAFTPTAETVTIQDTTATYALSAAAYSVNNTAGTAEVSVIRTGYVADAATATYTTTAGTAVDGTNYTGTQAGTVSFAAGQQVAVLSVPVTAVANQGGNLTFTTTLNGAAPAAGVVGDFAVLGAQASAVTTIVDPTANVGTLTGVPTATTNIEVGGPYSSTFATLSGDTTFGSGSLSFYAYDVLDFTKAGTPKIYPVGGSTVTSLSNLSVQLYNGATTGTFGGQPGNINVYYSPDATTAPSKLKFNASSTTTGGLDATQFTAAPISLGSFSFTNAAVGYDTYTPSTFNATAQASLLNALNKGLAFRLIVTPGTIGAGSVAADINNNSPTITGVPNNGQPVVSLVAATSAVQEYVDVDVTSATVDKTAGTATITVDRSTTTGGDLNDALTVAYNTSNGTGTSGTDFTGTQTGTVAFAAGAAQTTISIPLINNPAIFGDKTFSVTISAVTAGAGHAAAIVPPATETVTIHDGRTTTVSEAADNLATVQTGGPRVNVGTTVANNFFDVEGLATTDTPAFGVLDFNDPGSTITVPAGTSVTGINAVTLSTINSTFSASANGTFNVYIVDDTTTSIANTGGSPLAFVGTDPEGLGTSQFTARHLLGNFTYNTSQSSTAFTTFQLTTGDAGAKADLISALNNGTKFRLVITPADGATSKEVAGFKGLVFSNGVSQAPTIGLNYTVGVPLPAYLDPASQATYSATTNTVTVTGPTTIIADPGAAAPNIVASGTAATLSVNTSSGSQVHLASLTLANGASSTLATSPRSVVLEVASGLTIDSTSTLNLGNGDLDVANGSLSTLTALLTRGYNGGAWNGTGITSSAAAGDVSRLTAVGIELNSTSGSTALRSSFDGDPSVAATDVLLKYTYYGDANLDGIVNGIDYAQIDAGFNTAKTSSPLSGWFNGDFDYNVKVDASDYTLIDNAFNLAKTPLSFSTQLIAIPAAAIASATPATASATSFAISPPITAATPVTATVIAQDKKGGLADQIDDLIGKAK